MRKPAFCICENLLFAYAKTKTRISCTVTAQLIGKFVVVFFCYLESTTPILSKPLAIFCGRSAWIVSELIRNPCDVAHVLY